MPKIMYRNTAYGEIISDSNIKYGDFDCSYIEPLRTIDDYIENGVGNLCAVESGVSNIRRILPTNMTYVNLFGITNIQLSAIFGASNNANISKLYLPSALTGTFYNGQIGGLYIPEMLSVNFSTIFINYLYAPKLQQGTFRYVTGATYLDLPDFTGPGYFYYMYNLETLNAPEFVDLSGSGFARNPEIKHIYLPKCTAYSGKSSSLYGAFPYCTSLQTVNLPAFTQSDIGVMFNEDVNLELVDFGSMTNMTSTASSTSYDTFNKCTKFKTLIIRTPTLCTLSTINVFRGSPFASNGSGGTLYVPQALISSYRSAANWNTILGYPNNKILPLEGSPYETPSTSYDHY